MSKRINHSEKRLAGVQPGVGHELKLVARMSPWPRGLHPQEKPGCMPGKMESGVGKVLRGPSEPIDARESTICSVSLVCWL